MASSPSVQITGLRPDLRDGLVEFDLQADQAGFVGLKLAPSLDVGQQAGTYPIIPIEALLQQRDTLRASDGSYARGGGKFEKGNYATEEHGFEELIDEREAAIYREWIDAEQVAAGRARDAVLRNHNARVIALANAVANATAAGTAWSSDSSDPVENVKDARLAIRNRIGRMPNAMCMDITQFERLKLHPAIIDRIKYSGIDDPKRVTVSMLSALFELELVISGAVYNSANEAKTASLASMWTASRVLVFVRGSGPDLREPQWARTIHWSADGSMIGGTFESYYSDERRATIVRNRMETDEIEVYAAAAQVITGC